MDKNIAYDFSRIERKYKEFDLDNPLAFELENWPECCIYKVPKSLREVNEGAYTPKLVSIGPLHYHKKELKNMDKMKFRFLREFCWRTNKTPMELASIIAEDETKIRHCYSETFELSSEEFMNMVLLDSIFIVNLFCRKLEFKSFILHTEMIVMQDLMLLENQLPFFVLEKLYEAVQSIHNKPTFLRLCLTYFVSHFENKPEATVEEVKHLTDLLRKQKKFKKQGENPMLQCTMEQAKDSKSLCSTTKIKYFALKLEYSATKLKYSATKLKHAGLKFKVNDEKYLGEIKLDRSCLAHLRGKQHVLQLPCLLIQDKTEGLLRNLMALEMCHYPFDTYICSYVLLLSNLINNKEDVDLLVEKGIIINYVGSNEDVAKLIKKLCIRTLAMDASFSKLIQVLNGYYEHYLNYSLVSLRRACLGFWEGIATPAALWEGFVTFVLLFTFGVFLWQFIVLFQRK